ncbi:MAG: class I SAM-dependent methyltransferase [Candidatus Obscuribacterales bacterium]|nr:class I SAM-dependent methyltransferase [Candidatus Obscuribacterales bacterium]
MSGKDIKLALNAGVELKPTATLGISSAVVIEAARRFELTWDRFLRLYNTAEFVRNRLEKSCNILDVGGFDGALAMFLPEYVVDVIDPITTSGTGHSITAQSYDVVVSIDALEHVPPDERQAFIQQLSNAAREYLFINFPGQQTASAQQLIYQLTNNPLVKEHVLWQLPDRNQVRDLVARAGFEACIKQHTSLAQWISQYLLQTAAPDVAAKANRYLLEHFLEEPVGTPLYDLIIGRRITA